MKHCSNCNNQINEGDIFCEGCGIKVVPYIVRKSEIGLVDDKQKDVFYERVALIFVALFIVLIILAIGYSISY